MKFRKYAGVTATRLPAACAPSQEAAMTLLGRRRCRRPVPSSPVCHPFADLLDGPWELDTQID